MNFASCAQALSAVDKNKDSSSVAPKPINFSSSKVRQGFIAAISLVLVVALHSLLLTILSPSKIVDSPCCFGDENNGLQSVICKYHD